MKVVLLAVAGAAGALSRYGIGVALGVRSFPWTTLGINLAGSLLRTDRAPAALAYGAMSVLGGVAAAAAGYAGARSPSSRPRACGGPS